MPSEELASRVYDLANSALIVGLVIGLVATGLIVWMGKSKDSYLTKRIADANSAAARANSAAADANERAENARQRAGELSLETEGLRLQAHNAELELARLTGPPYQVPVSKDGVAIPDLSKGDKQFVLLTQPTHIVLPVLPKGKSLSWTLVLRQDAIGQHHFTTAPNVMPSADNILDSPPFSSWTLTFVTDDKGTIDTTFGGAKSIPAPSER
jgi:hypothetical protein